MSRVTCATCGASPIGTFNDGSPRFDCYYKTDIPHVPIRGVDAVTDVKVIVELDEPEMKAAAACGKRRLKRAEARRAKDQLGSPSLISHTIGAQGEAAFAKWLGQPFVCTTGQYGGKPDVAGCQVRTVTKTGAGVVVHESDPARIPVVSIVAHGSRFWLRGWIFAREAQLPEFVKDPGDRRPAYFLPAFELRPMDALYTTDLARRALGLPPMSEASA